MNKIVVPPAALNLSEIVALARRQLALQEFITDVENALAALKDELRGVQEEDLPLAMKEAGGLESLKLDDGATVQVKADLALNIKAEDKPRAYKWLEEHNYGAVVATTVTTSFNKGEMPAAQALLDQLAKRKYTVVLERSVHWQTLKALLLEQTLQGKRIPLDLFGARTISKAIVKPPKKGN